MPDWLFLNHNEEIEGKLTEVIENRKAWVGALLSGDYEQGEGYLCKDDKYCCLGVAADILKESMGVVVDVDSSGITYFDGNMVALSEKMKEALGLSDRDEVVLISLNDNGAPFKAIANALDEMTPAVDGLVLDEGI